MAKRIRILGLIFVVMTIIMCSGLILFPQISIAESNVPALDLPTIKTNSDGNQYIVGPIICPLWNDNEHISWDAISPYQDRKPLIGFYNQDNPEVWDWFIKWNAERGCTVFNFVWFKGENTNNPYCDSGLSTFKQSKFFNNMKYTIILDWTTFPCTGLTDFENNFWPYLRQQFLNSQYLKLDNKPILYEFGHPPETDSIYSRLRTLAQADGFSGVYIISTDDVGSIDYTFPYASCSMTYGINPTPAQETEEIKYIMSGLKGDNTPLVGSSNMHPSNLVYDAVRTWTAPEAGTAKITGNVRKIDVTGGDGVRVRIMKNSTQIWPASGWQTIAYDDSTGYDYDITTSVDANDKIYFVVNANTGNYWNDMTYWDPAITAGGIIYQASTGFSGTQGQNQWNYQYCSAGGSSYSNLELWSQIDNEWQRGGIYSNKIGEVFMGFDNDPWSKKLNNNISWRLKPSAYQELAQNVKTWMDSNGSGINRRLVLLGCWDEFGEGHYVCPTEKYGYGYLDAVRSVFTSCDNTPYSNNPLDDGFGPYDSYYKNHQAYYNFDANNGSTIQDASGFSRDATASGGTWTSAGRFGGAWTLNGTSDYLQISGADATHKSFLHNYYGSQCVSMWVKVSSTSGIQMLYDEGDSTTGLAMKIQDGSLVAGDRFNGNAVTVSSPYPSDGQWHQVCVAALMHDVFSSQPNLHLKLYLDGKMVNDVYNTPWVICDFVNPVTEGTYIGKREGNDAFNESGAGAYLNGMVDDVIINNVLSDDDVAYYYNNTGTNQFAAAVNNVVDDWNERIRYSQDFMSQKYYDVRFYNNTGSKTNKADEYFEFSFEGSSVEWYTETGPNNGTVDIYIDNVLDATIDSYSASDKYKVRKYTKTWGYPGNHTIKIVNKENKTLVNDRFVISEGFLYQASMNFSGSQGLNQWRYQYCSAGGSDYTDLAAWDSASSRWWKNSIDDLPLIGSSTIHPSNLDYDAVRTWVSPGAGNISIIGNVRKDDIGGGDGVRVKIMKNSMQIWPANGWQTIAYDDADGYDYNVTTTVAANDSIYFVVNANIIANHFDMVEWDPSVYFEPVHYQASAGFSSTQGANQWHYQYCTAEGSDYADMATWDSAVSYWWRSGINSFPFVGSDTMHPSNLDYDSVRTWIAPNAGNIRIMGNVKKGDTLGGDGVRVKIMKNGTQIWPAGGWQTIAYNDAAGYDYNVVTTVAAEDRIYFIVNANTGNYDNDTTVWDPLVYYDPKADAINQDNKNSIVYFFNNRPISSSTDTFRILFIGDSLTLVGPTPGVWDWYSGMAATDVSKDFVHLFSNRVQQNKTKQVEIFYDASGLLVDMKSNLDSYILNQVRPNLVVMQGGENDIYDQATRELYDQLLAEFSSFQNTNGEPLRVVVLGDWWSAEKSDYDQSIAQKYGYPFVNIVQINTLENKGFAGPYNHPGVAEHPNDSGMQSIADALYNAFVTLGNYW